MQKSNNRDFVLIVLWTIAGYPLLSVMLIYTDWPTFIASSIVRLVVIFTSVFIILRVPQTTLKPLRFLFYCFFFIYLLRMLVDLLVEVPNTLFDATFFCLTAMLPAIAVSRVSFNQYDEKALARYLTIFGAITAIAALVSVQILGADGRSLLEATGRLSFDAINPISLGEISVSTLIAVLSLICLRKSMSMTWLIPGIAACLLLTASASRGPLVELAISLIFWILFWVRGSKKIIFFIAAILLVCGAVQFLPEDSQILQRVERTVEDQSTVERLKIQGNAIDQFFENPFFGSAHIELTSLNYPHNTIIESAMALGILGLVLFGAINMILLVKIIQRLRDGEILLPLLATQYLVGTQLSGSIFFASSFFVLASALTLSPRMANYNSPVKVF